MWVSLSQPEAPAYVFNLEVFLHSGDVKLKLQGER